MAFRVLNSMVYVGLLCTGCGAKLAAPPNLTASTKASGSESPTVADSTSGQPADALTATKDESVTSPLDEVPADVREGLDQFADATLQIQRVRLLQERGLQREYGLTDAQISALTELKDDVDTLADSLQRLKPAERQEQLETVFLPKARAFEALVDAQLNETQRRALFREILSRQRGAIIFLLPGVAEELSLTDAQRARLYLMIEENRQSINFDNLYNPIELARLVGKANTTRKAAEGLLTLEQRTAFEALLGD